MTFGRKEMVIQKMLKEQEGIQMKNTQTNFKQKDLISKPQN